MRKQTANTPGAQCMAAMIAARSTDIDPGLWRDRLKQQVRRCYETGIPALREAVRTGAASAKDGEVIAMQTARRQEMACRVGPHRAAVQMRRSLRRRLYNQQIWAARYQSAIEGLLAEVPRSARGDAITAAIGHLQSLR